MRKNRIIDKNWSIENIKYGKYKSNVPGDITNDLYLAGRIENPLFGVNFKNSRWVLESPWDYSVSFGVDERDLDFPHAELVFNGIDTFSEVFLNGEKIGETDSMYVPFAFNVKEKLKVGENLLTVKMKSPYEVYNSKPNEKYMSIFHPARIFFRKPACHFMWDWAPDFPGYGIYRPVELSFFDDDEIIETEITTDIFGNANFITKLNDKFKYKPEEYSLKLSVTKNPDGDFSGAYEVKLKCEGQFVLQNVCVKSAKLWYPNGYGEQNLYSYKLELFRGDKVVDEKSGKFAFREVKIIERPLDEKSLSFIINVNGTDVFCKGSNWVPASNMTGTIKDETYRHLLSAAKEANYNILRVWGGGLYENDIFYKLCDEKGIMVWQDFMFACSDLPDDMSDFRKTVYKEAEYQLKRLRNHPSVVLWCGGNERRKFLDCKGPQYGEYVWEIMLRALHDKLTRQSVYVPNSPHSRTDIDMDYSSGDLHTSCYDPALIDDRICDYREYLATNLSPFTTECAILGPCRIRSIKKFIPNDKLWGVNEVWHEHFMLNPYSATPEETFIAKEQRMASSLFGEIDTLEKFVKKSMAVHLEIMRSEIEFARASDRCYGILNWMFNDIWGCGTWSVIDFYGEKKPVFYIQKAAFKPVHTFFYYGGKTVNLCVCNDNLSSVSLKLTYAHKSLNGEVYFEKTENITVPAGGKYIVKNILFDSSVKNAYLNAEISGGEEDKSIYFYDLWKNKPFVSDIAVEKEKTGEKEFKIKIRAKKFARLVFIDTPYETNPEISDNYFDMEAGEEREITVKTANNINEQDITLKTYADLWEE